MAEGRLVGALGGELVAVWAAAHSAHARVTARQTMKPRKNVLNFTFITKGEHNEGKGSSRVTPSGVIKTVRQARSHAFSLDISRFRSTRGSACLGKLR